MTAMPSRQDIVANLKRLSVQAGLAGGALTAALGALPPAAHVHVPPAVFVFTGALTAIGVFAGRMWPQPGLGAGE
jgi:hypothetical protein